jgi:nucleotide sugar dehydrogenase
MTTISVFGLGRVGLCTAVCFAKKGYRVLGIEIDERVIELIRNAQPPFFEPYLNVYLKEAIAEERLIVTSDPSSNSVSDLAFITVGTWTKEGRTDFDTVERVAASIGRSLRHAKQHQLIVIKSTVTPGTSRKIVRPAIERESNRVSGQHFGLCTNPEFLRKATEFVTYSFQTE